MTTDAILEGLGRQRTERKCRHVWARVATYDPSGRHVFGVKEVCANCQVAKDETKSRRGRNARKRGNRRELELARELGGEKVGQFGGPDDVRQSMFSIQSKVRGNFPSWMTAELDKLPRTGDRVPVLIVTGPPGLDPTDRRRRPAIAVVHLRDWKALHGDESA